MAFGSQDGLLEKYPALGEIVRRLVRAYEPDLAYLFGSKARGDAGPDSDYDLLVVVPDDASPERQRSRLAYQALRGTGIAADILVCTRSYFDARRHLKASLPTLKSIVDRGVPLTEYAWRFGYPGEPESPGSEESEEALDLAREVYDAIAVRLPREVPER